MKLFTKKSSAVSVEELLLIATGDVGAFSDEVVLSAWERLAAFGIVVVFDEGQPLSCRKLAGTGSYQRCHVSQLVQAQWAQTRLLASGIQALIFDDNTIRIDIDANVVLET